MAWIIKKIISVLYFVYFNEPIPLHEFQKKTKEIPSSEFLRQVDSYL